MRYNRSIPGKGNEVTQRLLLRRSIGNVGIANTGQFRNFFRYMHPGINKGVKYLFHFPTCENAGSDLSQPFRLGIDAGRLGIKGDEFGIQRELTPA